MTDKNTINIATDGSYKFDIEEGNIKGLSIVDSTTDDCICVEDTPKKAILKESTPAAVVLEPAAAVVLEPAAVVVLEPAAAVDEDIAITNMKRLELLAPSGIPEAKVQLQDRLKDLTPAERISLDNFLSNEANCKAIAETNKTDLYFHLRLSSGRMLKDPEVNAMIGYIADYLWKEVCNHPATARIMVKGTYFITKLLSLDPHHSEANYNYEDPSFKKSAYHGFSFVGVDMLFIPINDAYHWTVAVIMIKKKQIRYYDSLRDDHKHVQKKYGRILQRYVKDVLNWYHETPELYEFIVDPDCPQQTGSVDCGVFMCMFIDILSAGLELPMVFSPAQVSNYRLRMQLFLFKGELSYPLRIKKKGYFKGYSNLKMQENAGHEGSSAIDFPNAALKQFILPKFFDKVEADLVDTFRHPGVGGASESLNQAVAMSEILGEEIGRKIIFIVTELYADSTCIQNCASILNDKACSSTLTFASLFYLMAFNEFNWTYTNNHRFNSRMFFYSICTGGRLFYFDSLLKAFEAFVPYFMVSMRWIKCLGPIFHENVGVELILGPKLKGGGTALSLGYFQLLDPIVRAQVIK